MSDLSLLVDEATRARERGEPILVATVVDIQGSSYRRVGARMIVSNDRWVAGSVSGGCLEGDVVRRGAHRLRHGAPVVVTYDSTSDDEIGWGLGLGCNGVVKILLEWVDDTTIADPLQFSAKCIADQMRGVIVTIFESDAEEIAVGARLVLRTDAPILGTIREGRTRDELTRAANQFLSSTATPRSSTSVIEVGSVKALIEIIDPPPTLFVCGSNHDAVPIAKLAQEIGWRVIVATTSASAAINDRFAMADAILTGPVESLRREVELCARACAVVMSHDYERDRDVLGALLGSKLRYVGVLGPRRRTDRILRELQRDGAESSALHAPIGLDLGAETPQEIALAVVAEIQATLTGAPANRLREKEGPIHRSAFLERRSGVVAGAVLAAGGSKRLGRPKQLESFRTKKLVRHVVDELCGSSCAKSTVILGANADRIEDAISGSGAVVIYNDEWPEGIGSSIRAAARWAKSERASALVLLLADQPLIERGYVDILIDAWKNGAPAAGSLYGGVLGAPAIFDASLFDSLLELEGDRGAARLLRGHPGVVSISWSPGAVDVDTEADVIALSRQPPSAS